MSPTSIGKSGAILPSPVENEELLLLLSPETDDEDAPLDEPLPLSLSSFFESVESVSFLLRPRFSLMSLAFGVVTFTTTFSFFTATGGSSFFTTTISLGFSFSFSFSFSLSFSFSFSSNLSTKAFTFPILAPDSLRLVFGLVSVVLDSLVFPDSSTAELEAASAAAAAAAAAAAKAAAAADIFDVEGFSFSVVFGDCTELARTRLRPLERFVRGCGTIVQPSFRLNSSKENKNFL